MLQNLANKPSYAKEAYMITLNPFVENNKARINQFLNNLCEVGDFYDTLEVRDLDVDFSFRGQLTDEMLVDGSIYGTFQEGPSHPYHPQRVV